MFRTPVVQKYGHTM